MKKFHRVILVNIHTNSVILCCYLPSFFSKSKSFALLVESKDSTNPSGKMHSKGLVRPPASGGKRANVISSVLKRKLDYEPSSNIFGLTPYALAEADQPFVLYSPDKKLYMFVSHDSRVAEKNDSYVQARADKFGSNNLFKLIRVPGKKGKFYIYSLRQNRYLYASQSSKGIFKNWNPNLLAASGISSNPNEKASFIFCFEDDDGDGLFTIRNGKKILYVSENAVGNPPSNLLKLAAKKDLDRLDSKYFQFALTEVSSSTISARLLAVTYLSAGAMERQCSIISS